MSALFYIIVGQRRREGRTLCTTTETRCQCTREKLIVIGIWADVYFDVYTPLPAPTHRHSPAVTSIGVGIVSRR